ncbi:hypothetical protein [Brevundimonas sp.]|uniref:hypothetical protein n=1 Tax=Brevundimonas sp. TaxID=1871086 RepID=UPI0022C205DC|nr:hypothetical protein [Brevundimonas sp.]MCZ8195011.1 hypothetical protein [Brevundimonas sp.]
MTTSRKARVIQAVAELAAAALPDAVVERNTPSPSRTPAGGRVDVADGSQGDPEITLSPYQETYTHVVPLMLTAPETATDAQRHELLDQMLVALQAAVEADRTLGGLVEYLRLLPAEVDDAATDDGGAFVRIAETGIEATYTVSGPQGA